MKSRILIIDDEISICVSLSLALQGDYEIDFETQAAKGLERLKTDSYDLVLLDLVIGDTDGTVVMESIKRYDPRIIIIMMTAYGSIRSSVDAMKRGAFTYLTKPLDLEELQIHIRQALSFRELNDNVEYLNQRLSSELPDKPLIGQSHAIMTIRQRIENFRDVDTTILITGESGTGKNVVAHALHDKVKRRRYVQVNCHAMDEMHLERELFGFVETDDHGNIHYQRGKLDEAYLGTLHLYGVGDLPLTFQATLVRLLEEKTYLPVGGRKSRRVDTRIITSTMHDLRHAVEGGTFRRDLYYRLNAAEIALPPLRERREDIVPLCYYFLQHNETLKNKPKRLNGFTQEALEQLKSHAYPGNVRELANVIEYAGIVSNADTIRLKDLPYHFTGQGGSQPIGDDFLSGKSLQELEKLAITASYRRHGGKRKAIASELGISERGLWNKLKDYDLD